MTPEVVIDIYREALTLVVILVTIIVLPSLIVGLIVSIFQAATSINEQTLSFLPRLIVSLASMMFIGHWMFGKLMDFMIDIVQSIPSLIG
jgi:flagellar biosynthesis protein FliQ